MRTGEANRRRVVEREEREDRAASQKIALELGRARNRHHLARGSRRLALVDPSSLTSHTSSYALNFDHAILSLYSHPPCPRVSDSFSASEKETPQQSHEFARLSGPYRALAELSARR